MLLNKSAAVPGYHVAPLPKRRYYRPDPRHPERLQPAADQEGANPTDAGTVDLTAATINGAFRAFILDPHYSCVGAKSAINSGSYRLGVYDKLGGDLATVALGRDLESFVEDAEAFDAAFATFVAVFEGPTGTDPESFERLLWRQLQQLHNADQVGWDESVGNDPDSTHFSFSVAGSAFFVVGLHPGSGRLTRRFPWPALVFNPHEQFEKLRAEGKWGRMQEVIRAKEIQLQGDINPVLRDFGSDSEAKQYSGRPVGPDWQAPFEPRGDGHEPAAQNKCPFSGPERLSVGDDEAPHTKSSGTGEVKKP